MISETEIKQQIGEFIKKRINVNMRHLTTLEMHHTLLKLYIKNANLYYTILKTLSH